MLHSRHSDSSATLHDARPPSPPAPPLAPAPHPGSSSASPALAIEHCVGLSTTEGILAAREADVEAYVALGRLRSARSRGEPGAGPVDRTRSGDEVEKGSLSDKDGLEGDLAGAGEDWTYPDGGWRAWGVVFGVWCLAASQLGYGLLFGIFLEDLERRLHQTPATLNFIQGLANLGANAFSFVAGRLGDRYGFKLCIGAGCCLSVVSLVGAALSYKSLPALFVTQGVLLGISQGLGMSLFMAVPSQWFLKRRGLATGIAMSGSGIGGSIAALILRGTIKLGYRNALLIYTACNVVAYVLGFTLIQERHPPLKPGERRVPKNWLPKGVWRDGRFYSLMASVFIGVWGYLTPFYFITALTKQQCPEYSPTGLIVAVPLIVGTAVSGVGRVRPSLLSSASVASTRPDAPSSRRAGLRRLRRRPHRADQHSLLLVLPRGHDAALPLAAHELVRRHHGLRLSLRLVRQLVRLASRPIVRPAVRHEGPCDNRRLWHPLQFAGRIHGWECRRVDAQRCRRELRACRLLLGEHDARRGARAAAGAVHGAETAVGQVLSSCNRLDVRAVRERARGAVAVESESRGRRAAPASKRGRRRTQLRSAADCAPP